MNRKFTNLSGLAMVLIFVSACASGGMGDILGGGGGGTNSPSQYGTIRGTVDHVDVNNRSILLTNVSGLSSRLSNSGGNSGSTVRVYFDNQTSIQYQGQGYRPEDLERGDEVDVRVMESDNQLIAETVTVVRDSSPGTSTGGSYPQDTYGTTVTGTVRYIDANRRTIELDRGYGNGTMVVEYDDRTPVSFNNQTHRPDDLERGDEVQVRITNLGNNRYRADSISVVRSVSGGVGSSAGGVYGNQNSEAIRGTVRYVDTARRTIELESVSGISGFSTGAGSSIVIQYGSNATIDVRGQQLPLSGLERGDVIEAYVDRSGSSYIGNRFVLVRDANSY